MYLSIGNDMAVRDKSIIGIFDLDNTSYSKITRTVLAEAEKEQSSEIKLTHEQIAKYMGSAREVVSRMLKYFSSEGYVELSRGGVKITDYDSLDRLAL